MVLTRKDELEEENKQLKAMLQEVEKEKKKVDSTDSAQDEIARLKEKLRQLEEEKEKENVKNKRSSDSLESSEAEPKSKKLKYEKEQAVLKAEKERMEEEARAAAKKRKHELEQRVKSYCCPITRELMVEPVFAADGYTYEKSAISRWLENGSKNSPMNPSVRLHKHQTLVPNKSMKAMIQEYVESQEADPELVQAWKEVRGESLFNIGLFKESAEAGYAKAQGHLANAYWNGLKYPVDKKKAYEWAQKGAKQNDPTALYIKAVALAHGEVPGVAINHSKAVSILINLDPKKGMSKYFMLGSIYHAKADDESINRPSASFTARYPLIHKKKKATKAQRKKKHKVKTKTKAKSTTLDNEVSSSEDQRTKNFEAARRYYKLSVEQIYPEEELKRCAALHLANLWGLGQGGEVSFSKCRYYLRQAASDVGIPMGGGVIEETPRDTLNYRAYREAKFKLSMMRMKGVGGTQFTQNALRDLLTLNDNVKMKNFGSLTTCTDERVLAFRRYVENFAETQLATWYGWTEKKEKIAKLREKAELEKKRRDEGNDSLDYFPRSPDYAPNEPSYTPNEPFYNPSTPPL